MIARTFRCAWMAALVMVAACTVGPQYRRPEFTSPPQYKEIKGWKQAAPDIRTRESKWWESFRDQGLNALEEQVDDANPSLAQAVAQFEQAQAVTRGARAGLFPTFGISASADRAKSATGHSLVVPGITDLFAASGVVSWEPDVWGRVRRGIEADAASAVASADDLRALRLSLHAQLAQNYFQIWALRAQQRLLDETVTAYAKTLEITRNRLAVGIAAKADVLQAQTQLDATRATAIDLDAQQATLEHAIALLLGKAPAEFSLPSLPALVIPPAVLAGVPSELLERRPDIAAAERRVAAANAQIGVATAAWFPTLTLAASGGSQTTAFPDLFATATRFWALGPASLALTLFDGGARSAQIAAARAAHTAAAAAYRGTVLASFGEVENSLVTLRVLSEERMAQDAAAHAARESLTLTVNQYRAGTVSYLNVITAQALALNNQSTAIGLRGQQLVTTVLLIKAIGGGAQ